MITERDERFGACGWGRGKRAPCSGHTPGCNGATGFAAVSCPPRPVRLAAPAPSGSPTTSPCAPFAGPSFPTRRIPPSFRSATGGKGQIRKLHDHGCAAGKCCSVALPVPTPLTATAPLVMLVRRS